MQWRIYYGDSSTFDSDDGMLSDAPAMNVIAILVPGWSLWFGSGWYWYRDGQWYGGTLIDAVLHQLSYRTPTLLFEGRTIPDDQYKVIKAQAIEDRNRLNNG